MDTCSGSCATLPVFNHVYPEGFQEPGEGCKSNFHFRTSYIGSPTVYYAAEIMFCSKYYIPVIKKWRGFSFILNTYHHTYEEENYTRV